MIRKAALGMTGGLVLLVAAILFNTFGFVPPEPPVVEPAAPIAVDLAGAVERLVRTLRLPTISYQDPNALDRDAFLALHDELEASFPGVHATLEKEIVADLSLLYTWPGQNRRLKPLLLLAHQDVVPVLEGTEDIWTHPPFAGVVADGQIWGRGTLDNKSGVTGILEAVELLLAQGFTPARTVYLAFGHDEEVGGDGALAIAELLKKRGVELAAVVDEGGYITEGILADVNAPVALIGIAEKGYVTLELTAEGAGGHSSKPPKQTAVGVLSQAIVRLEEIPFPARFDGATAAMFEHVGPSLPWGQRVIFANLWLTRPLLLNSLSAEPSTSAMIRTTTAATMVSGSEKENVLPIIAKGKVNFRILPGETPESVTQRAREIIADPRVQVGMGDVANSPSTVSSTDNPAYQALEKAIHQVLPEDRVLVAPYLVIGQTDSRHFADLSEGVYRFIGARIFPNNIDGMHGTNEHLSVASYEETIRIFVQLLRNI